VVDTARVLHVFVAVVAISEHLAAVVALIAVTRLHLSTADAVPAYLIKRCSHSHNDSVI